MTARDAAKWKNRAIFSTTMFLASLAWAVQAKAESVSAVRRCSKVAYKGTK